MPRRSRQDSPGSWHHVFNRALSKRALFLSPADHRYFVACLAGAARSGTILVHRFALVLNHYHLLARSPKGRLDSAMHDVQMHYAQYLNRRLGRDGPLFCNRYKNRHVTSDAYHRTLVSYIDANPVAAGVVVRPEDYPWSSAAYHAAGRRPKWLSMDWIDARILEHRARRARLRCLPRDLPLARGSGIPRMDRASTSQPKRGPRRSRHRAGPRSRPHPRVDAPPSPAGRRQGLRSPGGRRRLDPVSAAGHGDAHLCLG